MGYYGNKSKLSDGLKWYYSFLTFICVLAFIWGYFLRMVQSSIIFLNTKKISFPFLIGMKIIVVVQHRYCRVCWVRLICPWTHHCPAGPCLFWWYSYIHIENLKSLIQFVQRYVHMKTSAANFRRMSVLVKRDIKALFIYSILKYLLRFYIHTVKLCSIEFHGTHCILPI